VPVAYFIFIEILKGVITPLENFLSPPVNFYFKAAILDTEMIPSFS
jgi:hypothetical protein